VKILIIDDSRFFRLINQKALTRAGHDVIGTHDGELGLQIAVEKKPDLVLLDMMLPNLSGPDVLRALKKDPRTSSIPVIVLSGLSGKNKQKLLREGASDFLEKSDDLLANDSAGLVSIVERAFLNETSSNRK